MVSKELMDLLHGILHRTKTPPAPAWRRLPFSELHLTIQWNYYKNEAGKWVWDGKDPTPIDDPLH